MNPATFRSFPRAIALLLPALILGLAPPARGIGPFDTVIAPIGVTDDAMGWSIANVGDVNDDGYDDLLVGLPVSDLTHFQAGVAHLYFGGPTADAVPDLLLEGAVAASDEYGEYVSPGGDLNGDGYRDFVVGAHYNDEAAYDAGKVFVYFGGPALDNVADLAIPGYYESSQFGHTLTGAGDLNGDGWDDLVVGAWLDATGGGGGGRVYVYLGGPGFDATPDFTLTPPATGQWFGHTLRSADLTGDGWIDLIVSDPHDTAIGVEGGRVYIYAGGPGFDTTPERILAGATKDQFGWGLGVLGDVDGDGYQDLGVGTISWNGWSFDYARVRVYFGGPAMDGVYDLTLEDPVETAQFGYQMIGVGDLTGDGYADFIVSNLGRDSLQGKAYLYAGGPGLDATVDYVFDGPDPGGSYGRCMAPAGDFNGDGRQEFAIGAPYSAVGGYFAGRFWVYTAPTTLVTPQPPATCITPTHACVEVPVTIERMDTTPLRGFSVDVLLSAGLTLCPPEIVEGSFLNNGGGGGGRVTYFDVIDNGGGSYTIDGAILGLPCGETDATGTLFTLHVASILPSGTETVTVTDVLTRDCSNAPVAASPGPAASVSIDNSVPKAITGLGAMQRKSGNGTDGTTAIVVSWPAVEAGTAVHIYRAGFGNYPEYDDPPGAGTPPVPVGYPPAGWTLAGTVTGGATILTDEPTSRDFWYYVAFVEDACGNVSAASNRTNGTLNYHLGDVIPLLTGDNDVMTADISRLGAHYGVSLDPSDSRGDLDVGPTSNLGPDARPTTDNTLQFEDLMMFAINYRVVSAPGLRLTEAEEVDALNLVAPDAVEAGELVSVSLRLRGSGRMRGLSTQLAWDEMVLTPVAWSTGNLAENQGGVVFSAGPGNLDAALLASPEGIRGEGILGTWTFRALAAGAPGIWLSRVDARDVRNQRMEIRVAADPTSLPSRTTLGLATPNPFRDRTDFLMVLAGPGRVDLTIYSVDGRRVRTVVSGTFSPGHHPLTWDGRDDSGHLVANGLYLAQLRTPAGLETRRVIFKR